MGLSMRSELLIAGNAYGRGTGGKVRGGLAVKRLALNAVHLYHECPLCTRDAVDPEPPASHSLPPRSLPLAFQPGPEWLMRATQRQLLLR